MLKQEILIKACRKSSGVAAGAVMSYYTLTYARSVSASSKMTFLSFSASLSCRVDVNRVWEVLLIRLPVGLDLRVSTGDRQKPVTCSAVLSKFSISKEFVRELTFIPESVSEVGRFSDSVE